jgi:hypothetical protein
MAMMELLKNCIILKYFIFLVAQKKIAGMTTIKGYYVLFFFLFCHAKTFSIINATVFNSFHTKRVTLASSLMLNTDFHTT